MKEKEVENKEIVETESPKELLVEIKISEKNLSYRSDFSEAETIFWIEAVKDLIIKKAFSMAGVNPEA
jgi:hypothetical protein